MPDPIVVVPYHASWPDQFQRIRGRLNEVLGPLAERIEHVGSTAVFGLCAKPIIDMDIVVAAGIEFAPVRLCLEKEGYDYLGDQGVPGREAFAVDQHHTAVPEHHLYVCSVNSTELRRHLAFRDYLLSHPERAEAYGNLKCNLAARYRNDRNTYMNAKSEFIAAVLVEAFETD